MTKPDDLKGPNGIVISPDNGWLYVTDSFTPSIYRWKISDEGFLGERETFATISQLGLDGLAFDRSGRLWCCTKTGVSVFDQDGTLFGELQFPGKPTSIAFSPKPYRTNCVTTLEACFIFELPE